MKQIITFLIAVVATLVARADYSTLSFRTEGGATHYLAITGLEISFTQENLTASNRETSISLPLAQIESMAFSDLAAGVNAIDSDKMNGAVSVYSLSGTSLGAYSSFPEALNRVPIGIYLFKYSDGTTLKIAKQ